MDLLDFVTRAYFSEQKFADVVKSAKCCEQLIIWSEIEIAIDGLLHPRHQPFSEFHIFFLLISLKYQRDNLQVRLQDHKKLNLKAELVIKFYQNRVVSHYLFDTSRVYTIVEITLKQNYIQLYIS